MNKEELVQEVIDRGYNYEKEARIEHFIERAYAQLCAWHPLWPFLEASKEGVSPLEIADLGQVLSVNDTTNSTNLRGIDRRLLTAGGGDLTATGSPSYWYLEGNTLKVFPFAANTLRVRYQRQPKDLKAGEEPLVPEPWQYLIIDRAIVECLKDNDEYSEARQLKADVEAGYREMLTALVGRNLGNSETITRTGIPADYL